MRSRLFSQVEKGRNGNQTYLDALEAVLTGCCQRGVWGAAKRLAAVRESNASR